MRVVAQQAGTYTVTATRSCGPPLTAQITAQVTVTPATRPAYSSASGLHGRVRDGVPVCGATQATYRPTRLGAYAVVVSGGWAQSAPVKVSSVVTRVGWPRT